MFINEKDRLVSNSISRTSYQKEEKEKRSKILDHKINRINYNLNKINSNIKEKEKKMDLKKTISLYNRGAINTIYEQNNKNKYIKNY